MARCKYNQVTIRSRMYALVLTNGTRLSLITKSIDDLGAGSDESQASLLYLARKFGVLGEESISL